MEWRWLLLADGCPDAGEPLPHCLGDWTGEHDMAEAGELAHASMVRAGMRLWSTSADVPEEGPNKEPAMQQAPCCDVAPTCCTLLSTLGGLDCLLGWIA